MPPLVVLTRTEDGPVGVTPDGEVLAGDATGEDWTSVGSLGGSPEALQADDGTLYASVTDQGLFESSDGGATWTARYAIGGDTAGAS